MNPGRPRIALCTTCKNRTQHLEQTLPLNLLHNISYPNIVFVVLDYNTNDHLHKYITDNYLSLIERGILVIYSYRTPTPFHMSHAKNMVHRLGILEGADILVNVDADNITGPDFAHYIATEFRQDKMFMWANMIKGEMPRGISGRIAVTKQAFILSGGYDEKYDTWGPDDKHFNGRLRKMGFQGVEIDKQHLLGVRHNDRLRFKEYRHAETTMLEEEFNMDDCPDTVSNFGNIGCGIVYKNFDFSLPVAVDRIPTRIFGIGMHKTATTSLHHALGILGLDSAHWKSAHWAKAIWNEVRATGRSSTVEDNYCLSDLPIPLLYRELDTAYPNSKFILTIRDEDEWIESVRKHWSNDNEFNSAWATDPFTHQIHRELYGQKGFDRNVFLERYRRHNREVIKYFEGRPNDLLVMDMDEGGDWFKLCRFLNRPIPSEKYPRAFVSRKD